MRRVLGPAAVASMLLLLTAQLALGAGPVHDKFSIDESIPEELCGIDVTTHVLIKGNVLEFDDRFVDVSRAQITWTNADGDWLQNIAAGPSTFVEVLEGDILTITERHVGVHERLRSSAGLTPAFDRGQIVFLNVIDLNDLGDDEDDVFLSAETLFQAGPHPEADSGFELFCEVVTDVLG